jgi:Lrp/AsnC family transcriptional regulator for asnA, asnC and gidA
MIPEAGGSLRELGQAAGLGGPSRKGGIGVDEGERMLDDLDEIDIAILRLLEADGRKPTAQIARDLGVSEPTARKRIDRMFHDGIIKVAAILNPRKTGYLTDVLIGIRVRPGKLREVGQALAGRDNIVYLGYTTGRHDILMEGLFRDDEALFKFLEEDLPALEGIASTETAHVLRTEKINYDWKLPAEFGQRSGSNTSHTAYMRTRARRLQRISSPPPTDY